MAEYQPLPTVYEKEEDGSESDTSTHSRPLPKTSIRTWLWTWSWTFHLCFLVLYATVFYVGPDYRPTNLDIYEDAPREVETTVFQQAGFHGPLTPNLTAYEGRPNEHNNAEWDRLMEVGVIGISEEEASRLPGVGTIRSKSNPDAFVVQLELFHQLHCLKQLRMQLWEFEDGLIDRSQTTQRQQHFDHCIDYLRQAVMCHGDLTPVTFEWNEELSVYFAHHSTVHQCRSFEPIFQWAKVRHTVGIANDGKHKDIDGAAKFDHAYDHTSNRS